MKRVSNARRMINRLAQANAVKTHCPYGHKYDDANTVIMKNGGRQCRACHRAWRQHLMAHRASRISDSLELGFS
jgi:hypothetical protein